MDNTQSPFVQPSMQGQTQQQEPQPQLSMQPQTQPSMQNISGTVQQPSMQNVGGNMQQPSMQSQMQQHSTQNMYGNIQQGVTQMDNGTGVFPPPTPMQQQGQAQNGQQQSTSIQQQSMPTQQQTVNNGNVMQQSYDYKDGQGAQQSDVQQQQQYQQAPKKKMSKNMVLMFSAGGLLLLVLLVGVALTVAPKHEKIDPIDASDLEFDTIPFEYTHDEIVALRKAGYTGDEIEAYEEQMYDSYDLIKQAEDERRAIYESEIAPYYDEASDEVKKLYEDSWCGQAALEVVGTVDEYKYMTVTINVDYEKIPATGYQCFIKVYIHDDRPAFMTVTPDRYLSLKDSGNIVLQVDYIVMPNQERCITSMKEIIP